MHILVVLVVALLNIVHQVKCDPLENAIRDMEDNKVKLFRRREISDSTEINELERFKATLLSRNFRHCVDDGLQIAYSGSLSYFGDKMYVHCIGAYRHPSEGFDTGYLYVYDTETYGLIDKIALDTDTKQQEIYGVYACNVDGYKVITLEKTWNLESNGWIGKVDRSVWLRDLVSKKRRVLIADAPYGLITVESNCDIWAMNSSDKGFTILSANSNFQSSRYVDLPYKYPGLPKKLGVDRLLMSNLVKLYQDKSVMDLIITRSDGRLIASYNDEKDALSTTLQSVRSFEVIDQNYFMFINYESGTYIRSGDYEGFYIATTDMKHTRPLRGIEGQPTGIIDYNAYSGFAMLLYATNDGSGVELYEINSSE